MKIAIVGTGAMGCVYAALLGDAGNEVWAVDLWEEHIEAIKKNGLRLEGKSGDRTVRIQATTKASDVGVCDLVIIATKAMHVVSAAESARTLVGSETTILPIQNGLGSPEKVARILGQNRTIIGVAAGFGASMKAPGHAHHNGMDQMRLGELNGSMTPRLEAIAQIWQNARFTVKTFDDINQLIWEKLICNACFSGTCAITQWTLGQVMDDEDAWRVAAGCAMEAYLVAKAKEIRLNIDNPLDYVRNFGSKMPTSRPSMLLDLLEGRASEIDAINGAIPPEGEKVGVPTPFNTVVTSIVRTKERHLGLR